MTKKQGNDGGNSLSKTKVKGTVRTLIKKIISLVMTVLFISVCVLVFLLVGVRLIGLKPYAVLSGSMEPTYPIGSLIYVRHIEPEEVEVGQSISFVFNESGSIATHRVVRIDDEAKLFYTKGDANSSEDGAPVLYENYLGTPVFCIPQLGYLSQWLTKPYVRYLVIGLILLILLSLVIFPDKKSREDKQS